MLDKHGVKATFFSIGHYAREQPALLREVAAAGHAIGNHTYNHVTMALHTDDTIREELRGHDARRSRTPASRWRGVKAAA